MKIGLSLNITLRNHTGPAVAGGAHSRPDSGLDDVIACATTINDTLRSSAMLQDSLELAQLLLYEAKEIAPRLGMDNCSEARMMLAHFQPIMASWECRDKLTVIGWGCGTIPLPAAVPGLFTFQSLLLFHSLFKCLLSENHPDGLFCFFL